MGKVINLASKLKNIAQGWYYSLKKDLPDWFMQQVYYRMASCPGCVNAGRCYACKCISPALFFAPEKSCALGRWPEMMEPEEWAKFMERNDITEIKMNDDIISESPTGPGHQGDSGILKQSGDNEIPTESRSVS